MLRSGLTGLVGLALAGTAFGQECGPTQILAGQIHSPRSAAVGDLDGDGDLDSILGGALDGRVVWFENLDGTRGSGPAREVADYAGHVLDVAAADVDGDGDVDLLATYNVLGGGSGSEPGIAWFENLDGRGNFGAEVTVSTGFHSSSVVTVDVDGDGDVDVLAGTAQGGAMLFENTDGQGSFGPPQLFQPVEGGGGTIDAADLDGDGDVDVVFANAKATGETAWYENLDGAGSFGPARTVAPTGGYARVRAADLDGDGDADLLVSLTEFDRVVWHENLDGAGTFGGERPVASFLGGADDVNTADLDGDGDLDVLTTAQGGSSLTWHENLDGGGNFAFAAAIEGLLARADRVLAADFDGDGDPDVLGVSYVAGRAAWHLNADGAGGFGPLSVLATGAAEPRSVLAVDLDGDGDLDVVSGSEFIGQLAWHENRDGSGDFSVAHTVATTYGGTGVVDAGDVDGDGDVDLLFSSDLGGNPVWFANRDGAGSFGAPRSLYMGGASLPTSLRLSDLNGDGALDVLVGSFGGPGLVWFENQDGAGGFGLPKAISAQPLHEISVTSSDLDLDGDQDVVSLVENRLVWRANLDGAGNFGPATQVNVGLELWSTVDAVDLDEDGDPDLLAGSIFFDVIGWYENVDGAGSFGPLQILADSASEPVRVHAEDLDGDGDLDVYTALANGLAWYENLGGLSSFAREQVVAATGMYGFDAVAADLDGDLDFDLVAALGEPDSEAGQIAWFEARGRSGFEPASEVVRTGVPPNPTALLPGWSTGPNLCSVWDPFIQHESFVTDAMLDLLIVSTATVNRPIPGVGTLLVDSSAEVLLYETGPGQLFEVQIPASIEFLGATFHAQGYSVGPTGAGLTNALDVTLGGL